MRVGRDEEAWVPPEGTLIAERYRLGPIIGLGGMAAVLGAEHVNLGERVAVKFLHPDSSRTEEAKQRFLREARISSLIRCEHVVRVLDVGQTREGLLYLVMEFLEGSDLSGFVRDHGPLPVQFALDCVLQASEALALAHAAGIVHRDLKPSNLWLSRRIDGTPFVKVLDFGISKLVHPGTDGGLTDTSSVFGSPTYMPPEQIRSAKHVDARADVWALGVVLYELLTARLPFESDNMGGILAAITVDPAPHVRVLRPDVPQLVDDVIAACLEKDPARRIDLTELAAELRTLASPVGIAAADRVAFAALPRSSQTWRTRVSQPLAVGSSTLSAATSSMTQRPASRGRLVAGAGALVLGAGIFFMVSRQRPVPPAEHVVTADLAALASTPAAATPSAPVAASSAPVVAPSALPAASASVVAPPSKSGKPPSPTGGKKPPLDPPAPSKTEAPKPEATKPAVPSPAGPDTSENRK